MRKEYVLENQEFNSNELYELAEFSRIFRRSIMDGEEFDTAGELDAVADILSVVSLIPGATVAGVASILLSMYSELLSLEKNTLVTVILNGEDSLRDIRYQMYTNGWTKVNIDMPMLEFVEEGVRVVQGECLLNKYYNNGIWFTVNN